MNLTRSRDKRKNRRTRAKNLTFVKLLSDSGEDIGQLLDISPEGIALRYFADKQKLRKYSQLGIVTSGGSYSIENIPFKIVSDIQVTGNPSSRPTGLRRCGLRFEELTSDQQSKLADFLQNHTIAPDDEE